MAHPNGRWWLSRRWILSHLFVLSVVALMTGLGFWQLQRLDDRLARNQQLELILASAPQEISALLNMPTLPPDHTKARASGSYLHEHSFLVANRTYQSQPGSWLATPLQLSDNTILIVSRGWVSRRNAAELVGDLSLLAGETQASEVSVFGRAYASVAGGAIGESANRESTQAIRELNRLDLAKAEELTGLEVAGLWLQLDAQVPESPSQLVSVAPPSLDDGPHLSYAFQWFFFASATVVVYFLILFRRKVHLRNSSNKLQAVKN